MNVLIKQNKDLGFIWAVSLWHGFCFNMVVNMFQELYFSSLLVNCFVVLEAQNQSFILT